MALPGTGDGGDEISAGAEIQDDPEDIESIRLSLSTLAEDIVTRSAKLLAEFQQFDDLRKSLQKDTIPGMSSLVQVTQQEHNAAALALRKLNSPGIGPEEVQKLGRLKYSNLPAHERDWDAIKRCRWLRCVSQSFEAPGFSTISKSRCHAHKRNGKNKEHSVFVDASVDGGAEWLRIVNIDEKRLLYEMADNGWDWGTDDDVSGNESTGDQSDDDDEDGISLIRIVKSLVHAARASWHNYQHPRVHLLLTRLDEGSNRETGRLFCMLRAMGGKDVVVTVDCANSVYNKKPVPSLEMALLNLVKEDLGELTSTLVIDTSILIALASDVSHSRVEIQPWHRGDLQAQIQEEAEGRSFLLANAFPVLRSKRLVCTELAAKHYWEIVSTIGTETEKQRANMLLSSDARDKNRPYQDLVADFQKLSIHQIPVDLRLPIEILGQDAESETDVAISAGKLPNIARAVEEELLDLTSNRATFMYGWLSGNTVVTSNNNLAKRMVRLIETKRASEKEIGPKIWVFSFNRALSTKGKPHNFDMTTSRRKKKAKKINSDNMTGGASTR